MISDYKTAKENFLASSISGCRKFFESKGHIVEAAYCYFVSDEIQKAKELFYSKKDSDTRAKWGHFVLCLIDEGRVYENPTYFEVRNFLEIDIQILISYFKGDYVEKLVSYADYLFTINPEAHKFIGRVFYVNGLKPQAIFFLERAKNTFYKDPELHFLLANIFNETGETEKVTEALENCLDVLPGYYPAVKMLNDIKNTA